MDASTSKQKESKGHPKKDSQTSASKKRKGKAKDNNPEPDLKQTGQLGANFWANDTPWSWTSLTDPCSNKIPPIFTRDGRCVQQEFIDFSQCSLRVVVTSSL